MKRQGWKSKNLLLAVTLLGAAGTVSATPVQWSSGSGGNDHWYEVVLGLVPWTDALNYAASQTHLGMTGYLATITSAEEQNFIYTTVIPSVSWPDLNSQSVWLGGSDADAEGVWKWMTGPEAGQTFWSNGSTLMYTHWILGQPSDSPPLGEDYLQFSASFWGGKWNDLASPLPGYLVEYSAVPEPSSLTLLSLGLVGVASAWRRRKHC